MNQITDFIVARAQEPTTWRGIAVLAGLIGINFGPEFWGHVGTAIAALMAIIAIVAREKGARA